MAQLQPQISLYEREIKNTALEDALEKRQAVKDRRKKLNKEFREIDVLAKSLLEAVELGQGSSIRVGRFLVRLSPVASREVAFTAEATSRLQISLIPE